jgi:hypothetical protein
MRPHRHIPVRLPRCCLPRAKRVRFHGDEEESSQCAAPVRLPRRSMEEVGSSSARGRKSYMRARAKLADSSDTRHGECDAKGF